MDVVKYIERVLAFVYHTFKHETIEVKLVWICIPIFFLVFSGLFFFLIIYRFKLKKRTKFKTKHKPLYEQSIIKIIMLNDTVEIQENVSYLRKETRKKISKKLVLSLILKLHDNVSGTAQEKLQNLYERLNLVKYSLKKLKSKKWHLKVKGLRELLQMNQKINLDKYIVPYLNHKNPTLREEMLLAYFKLDAEKALNYILNYKAHFSEWIQIEIMEILFQKRITHFQYINEYLNSKNDALVLFGLKIVKIYSLVQYKGEVIDLLTSRNEDVRQESISLVKKLKINLDADYLKLLYNRSDNYSEKHKILHTLKTLKLKTPEIIRTMEAELLEQFNYKRKTIPTIKT